MTKLFGDLAAAPELSSHQRGQWGRRATMTVLAAVAVAALLNAFGQVDSTSRAQGPAARVTVTAPARVRGGLMFQARVEIRAQRAMAHPRLVLARGWVEGLQVNSIEPAAAGEQARGDTLVLSYDGLRAGERFVVWMQFQADPTAPGRRPFDLELDDAERPLARVQRTITVLP